uniref:Uncharacterized protein n=1 Tax=Oryza rufipogon TaxID=4529 RepID=A0A0E0N6B0_ORYRU
MATGCFFLLVVAVFVFSGASSLMLMTADLLVAAIDRSSQMVLSMICQHAAVAAEGYSGPEAVEMLHVPVETSQEEL